MNVRLRAVALCLAVLFTAQAEVTVKEGAYHDLVVSFSPNVNATNGEKIVESLESLFTETSSVLQKAIGLRISGVTFHLPSTWDTSTWENKTLVQASVLPEDQRDLVVDDTVDSAFGTLPTTLQYGGCGVPGRRLTVPVGFLDESTEEDFPKEQLLAREWLKFRYGVFDENGFDGDDMYPLYYNIPGTTEARITECTDPEVEYDFRDTDGNNCSLEIPFASSTNCEIHPKEISQNTTSSLMYYHKELTNMMYVCGKEHNHLDSTPNKQNVLCSGQSIWEILEKSGDFNETKSKDPQSENEEIKFSYRQEAKPRVVLAFEDSANLYNERDMVMFAIHRFLYFLPDGSELGLYKFNKQADEIRALSRLETNRYVDISARFKTKPPDVCSSCALDKAVEALSGKSQVTNQNTIILITGSNSLAINDALFNKYKDVCLKIVVFTRAGDPVVDYDGIISPPGCHSISMIEKEVPDLIYQKLYKSLQESVTQSPTDTKVYEVAAGVMSDTSSLKINFPMLSTSAKYTLWMNKGIELGEINCTKADGNSIELAQDVHKSSIASYTFDPVDDLQEVNCKLDDEENTFTQVEMTSKPGEYIDGEVWVDDPSNGEQMPVIIYAKINYGSYPVQDATVTANVTINGIVHKLELLDNGRGDPDITQGDGIYSRYFVDLSSEGEYEVIVQVSDNSGNSQVGRKGQNPCCGSKVKSTQENKGFFNKSFKTSFHAKQKPENGFKPSRIFDLRVSNFDPQNYIILNWTAPGGEADKGNASSYVIRYFTSRDDIKKYFNNGTLLENSLEPKFHGSEETLEIKLDNFERSKLYYVAIKSLNILRQESDLSNVLEFFFPEDTDATKIDDGTTTDPSVTKQSMSDKKVIGIFIGVLVLVIVLIVAVYLFVHFFVRKPRRKRETTNKENGGVNRNATSPPISLNSIPADVILKHHNEVVSAKSQHKDPPIFKEENLESIDLAAETDGANVSDQRNNVEYSTVQKRQPEPGSHRSLERENALPPKRMTNV
ncbi:hypothetical protein JTE90_008377 [Oedothorax gibbosus]|uniref:Calcium-activated chloride channel N-terminal domain-containing protein n=1 Tax=Oedothorax gibbosus TaxID=931172 RepID=A0AAV6V4S5_9ARAC|nr:hypothetical protein JTE90_008377 [Oedothorax gibbosus]